MGGLQAITCITGIGYVLFILRQKVDFPRLYSGRLLFSAFKLFAFNNSHFGAYIFYIAAVYAVSVNEYLDVYLGTSVSGVSSLTEKTVMEAPIVVGQCSQKILPTYNQKGKRVVPKFAKASQKRKKSDVLKYIQIELAA